MAKNTKTPPIVLKKIGANVIMNFSGERYSKRVTQEEFATLSKDVNRYNSKPNPTTGKRILSFMTANMKKVAKEQERTKMELVGLKKLQKKKEKSSQRTTKEMNSVLRALQTQTNTLDNVDNTLSRLSDIMEKFLQHNHGERFNPFDGEY